MNRTTRKAISTLREALTGHVETDDTDGIAPADDRSCHDGAELYVDGMRVDYYLDDEAGWTACVTYVDATYREALINNADALRHFVLMARKANAGAQLLLAVEDSLTMSEGDMLGTLALAIKNYKAIDA